MRGIDKIKQVLETGNYIIEDDVIIDTTSAYMVTVVHSQLNEANKKKLEEVLDKDIIKGVLKVWELIG